MKKKIEDENKDEEKNVFAYIIDDDPTDVVQNENLLFVRKMLFRDTFFLILIH